MKLLGISGSLTPTSRTNDVIQLILDHAIAHDPAVETELLDLRSYRVAFCDGRHPDDYTGDTRVVIDTVADADAYVIGSPTYRGSYTGALKNLFDLVPNAAPHGKAAGIVLTAGSDHHFLAAEHQLRPLLSFFQMYTVPGVVYAQNDHFRDGVLTDEGVRENCRKLAREIVTVSQSIRAEVGTGPTYPLIQRKENP